MQRVQTSLLYKSLIWKQGNGRQMIRLQKVILQLSAVGLYELLTNTQNDVAYDVNGAIGGHIIGRGTKRVFETVV